MTTRVAIAGATGSLGRRLASELTSRSIDVRGLVRRIDPALGIDQVEGDLKDGYPASAFDGVTALVSCAGARRTADKREPRETFDAIDWRGHEKLIESAEAAGVEHVVLVTIINPDLFFETQFARSKERAVLAARQSRMIETIVRTTVLFSSLESLVSEARASRRCTIFGDGSARTNPIADEDLAVVIADAIRDQPRHVTGGGPEVFTREQIAEMACRAAGVEPRVRHIAPWVASAAARIISPVRPRTAHAMRYQSLTSEIDSIAPVVGTRSLREAWGLPAD